MFFFGFPRESFSSGGYNIFIHNGGDRMLACIDNKSIMIECEIYSRPVGYYRPTKQWNPGKQSEFADRKPLKIITRSEGCHGNIDLEDPRG